MAQLSEELQTVALKALATTLGKEVSDIEAILTGDKPTEVDKMVSDRIKAIRDEGDKKGKSGLQGKANAKAKELFGLDGKPETIEELLDAIKADYKPATDPGSLTEEQVKTHQAYRTLESTLKTKDKEHEKALQQARAEGKTEYDQAVLTAKAKQYRTDLGAVLSDDPKLAAVQERMFLEQLQGISTKDNAGTTEFWKALKDGEPTRVENDKAYPVSEADFFKGLVESVYTIPVSGQRQSTGLQPGSGQQNQNRSGNFTHFKGVAPKTQDELNAIILDKAQSFEARDEVEKWFNEQQKKS